MSIVRQLIIAVVLFAAGAVEALAGEWMTSFEEAKAAAAEKNLPIVANFSGSDWCGWCIKLDKEVFSQEDFLAYAKDNVILLGLDFPSRKPQEPAIAKQNKMLAAKYAIKGYPTILLLDATGKELARTGYRKGGPAAYVEHLKSLIAK
ncbi:MAG: thioredoxin family protein [Verrucomicrobia bacterium]|jgi:protein disulfide-isomerase|nr:thioredoxin family protein [Verrucomicrobiota bacterium]